jgi:hypothetical protein
MKLLNSTHRTKRILPRSFADELSAEFEALAEAESEAETSINEGLVLPSPTLSLEKRYSLLLTAFAKAMRKIQTLEQPVRTPEQHDMDLQHVRQFIASMDTAEGAVTCANLYTKQVLELDGDRRYVVDLCTLLVNQYASDSLLIEPTFIVWKSYAN